MKSKQGLFLFLLGILVLGGCSDDEEIPGRAIIYKEYLIDAYIVPEKITTRGEYYALNLSIDGPVYATWSTGADYSEFLRLAALHGGRIDREIEVAIDVCYVYSAGYGGAYVSYAEDFASIDVTCDQPLDETHPAGSSLKEYCTVIFSTFAPFVRAGNSGHGVVEEVKKLDALAEGDLDMIAYGTLSIVIPRERFSVPCTYTITFTTKSGRKLSVDWMREAVEQSV